MLCLHLALTYRRAHPPVPSHGTMIFLTFLFRRFSVCFSCSARSIIIFNHCTVSARTIETNNNNVENGYGLMRTAYPLNAYTHTVYATIFFVIAIILCRSLCSVLLHFRVIFFFILFRFFFWFRSLHFRSNISRKH